VHFNKYKKQPSWNWPPRRKGHHAILALLAKIKNTKVSGSYALITIDYMKRYRIKPCFEKLTIFSVHFDNYQMLTTVGSATMANPTDRRFLIKSPNQKGESFRELRSAIF